ncbi:MAG: PilZ domain-containing protein [Phycisphaerales bacterium]|nr:PilZ domain-containing protein [Phycisphaerales bacterium]
MTIIIHSDSQTEPLDSEDTPTLGGADRREHRRHDMEPAEITVSRWEGGNRAGSPLGQLVDLSAGGVRIRTRDTAIRPDQHIRLRLELPVYAGISPFINTGIEKPEPRNDWVGWLAVTRVCRINDYEVEVAGRLVDMEEIDRGMLGLYLSTQPLAA